MIWSLTREAVLESKFAAGWDQSSARLLFSLPLQLKANRILMGRSRHNYYTGIFLLVILVHKDGTKAFFCLRIGALGPQCRGGKPKGMKQHARQPGDISSFIPIRPWLILWTVWLGRRRGLLRSGSHPSSSVSGTVPTARWPGCPFPSCG